MATVDSAFNYWFDRFVLDNEIERTRDSAQAIARAAFAAGRAAQRADTPTERTPQRGGIDDSGPYNGINWSETLRAAAKRLRLGVEGPRIADELDDIAAALASPGAAA